MTEPNRFPAGRIRAQYIGHATTASLALWHVGTREATVCGMLWAAPPKLIERTDTYDRDWMCGRCLRSEGI